MTVSNKILWALAGLLFVALAPDATISKVINHETASVRATVTSTDKKKKHNSVKSLSRTEIKEAQRRLAEMGYGLAGQDYADRDFKQSLIAFQKWEGRKVTGQLTRDEFDAIMSATAPTAKDSGYSHVEVDVDKQILLLTDEAGAVTSVLPVSTGSERHYSEKGMSGLAYTPRGRFRIYAKIAGWRESPLGLLYYPNYFSDGLAIHGNPSVPQSPQSHGCIRIPMSTAAEISRRLPLRTIVLIYDSRGFVSAKDWALADKAASANLN